MHIDQVGKRMIEAPFAMHTTPGYHMVLFTLSDVVGRTSHPNEKDERDVQQLENDIFESVECLKEAGLQVSKRMEAICQA